MDWGIFFGLFGMIVGGVGGGVILIAMGIDGAFERWGERGAAIAFTAFVVAMALVVALAAGATA